MESRSRKPLVTKLEWYFIPFVLQTKAFQGHYLKMKELVEFRNISLIDTVHFVWYDYRDYMFNNIKSLPHTGDLQTKAFQGHYLKDKEIVEFRNISLIDSVHFVWYDYRDYMFNNIKSLPYTGDLKTKAFQGHYLKHKEIVEFRNISLIDTVHFVWYNYRDYMFNNIKSLPHTGDLKTKGFSRSLPQILRSSSSLLICIPSHGKVQVVLALDTWNGLPSHLSSISALPAFRKRLKCKEPWVLYI